MIEPLGRCYDRTTMSTIFGMVSSQYPLQTRTQKNTHDVYTCTFLYIIFPPKTINEFRYQEIFNRTAYCDPATIVAMQRVCLGPYHPDIESNSSRPSHSCMHHTQTVCQEQGRT